MINKLKFNGKFKPSPPKATNFSFADLVGEEAKTLLDAFGFKSVADIIKAEEDDWKNLYSRSPEAALKMYRDEREKRCILNELVWAIVKKHGGEIRIGVKDLAPFDWHLEETYDIETAQKVLKATIKP